MFIQGYKLFYSISNNMTELIPGVIHRLIIKFHNPIDTTDLRKYFFSTRIINIWNSLPNCVVDVSTINQFKARLDKFWMHQEVLYDYTADLTGIGDRSVHVTKDV